VHATDTAIASSGGRDTITGKGVTKFSLALTALLGVMSGRMRRPFSVTTAVRALKGRFLLSLLCLVASSQQFH
jgi:hypothetical protein